MFKFNSKNIKLVSNVLKRTSGLIFEHKNGSSVIKVRCISTGISKFSGDQFPYSFAVKCNLSLVDQKLSDIKSPLGNLIAKDKVETPNNETNENEEEARKKREQAWRTMKITLSLFGIGFTVLGGYLIFSLGAPSTDPDQMNLHQDIVDKPIWQQYLIRTYRELDFYTRVSIR